LSDLFEHVNTEAARPAISVGLWVSLAIVTAVVVGFYRIGELERWVQWFAQAHVAPVIGLVE
jgi:hypothetical protein